MNFSPLEKRQILEQNALFGGLSIAEIDRILFLSVDLSYTKGQIIFQKGAAGDSLLAILQGKVSISAASVEGKEIILNTIFQGEMFGEIACIDGIERSATATALEDCTLLSIQRHDFIHFLKLNPEIAIELLKSLCLKLRETSNRVETVSLLSTPVRLARLLVATSRRVGQQTEEGLLINWKKSQQAIGSEIGTSRESVNRILNQWKNKGILSLGGQSLSILIKDMTALAAISDEGF